ncbi:hypothetical protein [Nonlabens antarcticus]|uniref:hypothetical protein n=1 Tax=Nonlabens antarcticus TaxID=392714 RepID=UPI001891E0B6|nr:hypothetical protein [Nonlabens antarcticus]
MKKNLIIAAFAATALIACKNDDKTDDDLTDDNAMVTEMDMDEPADNTDMAKTDYTQPEVSKMQQDFAEAVEVKDGKANNVKGWMIYNNVNDDIKMLTSAKPDARMTSAQKLRTDFNELRNTLPEYLNVRRVRRAIDKIDARITNYEEDVLDTDVDEKRTKKNLEDINDAYINLSEQIAKAREQYIDNKEDAIEEYLEEINDIDKNMTYEERLRDAREEYNEEMKQK